MPGSLWVLVPLFNEVEVLPELQRRLGAVLDTVGLAGRVLYVDDGSRDGRPTHVANRSGSVENDVMPSTAKRHNFL